LAVPVFDMPLAWPIATGPCMSVYRLPFIGVTIAQPPNNTTALAPITNKVSILRIIVLLSPVLQVPPCSHRLNNKADRKSPTGMQFLKTTALGG